MFVLDVFSSPTLDIINGRLCRGGPAYYARLALYAIGASDARVRLPYDTCIDVEWYLRTEWCLEADTLAAIPECATVFMLEERDTGRRLKPLSLHKIGREHPKGTAALISPVLAELDIDNAVRLLSHYSLAVLDVQGFSRLYYGGEVTAFSENVLALVERVGVADNFIAIKASLEDIPDFIALDRLLRYSSSSGHTAIMVTAGPRGALILYSDYSFVIRPRSVDMVPTGAGDMFSTLVLYGVWRGYGLERSALGAATAVSCILERRDEIAYGAYGLCRDSFEEMFDTSIYRLPGRCYSIDCVISALEYR